MHSENETDKTKPSLPKEGGTVTDGGRIPEGRVRSDSDKVNVG